MHKKILELIHESIEKRKAEVAVIFSTHSDDVAAGKAISDLLLCDKHETKDGGVYYTMAASHGDAGWLVETLLDYISSAVDWTNIAESWRDELTPVAAE